MVKIQQCWDEKRNQLLDQAAPILETLKPILDRFEEPEAGYFGVAGTRVHAMYVRLRSRALVFEHETISDLLDAAERNDAVLSIDTREGPLVATIMKTNGAF